MAVVLLLGVPVLAWLLGARLLVVRSDSMAPALRTGDLLVSRSVDPSDVRVGQVVSFADSSRGGRSVTHRVVSTAAVAGGVAVTTRGDANTGQEQWVAGPGAPVGRQLVRIPYGGLPLAWLDQAPPRLRAAATAGAGAVALVALLSAIWRRP